MQIGTSSPGTCFAARIVEMVPGQTVTVFLRRTATGTEVVGVERAWPAKVIVDRKKPPRGLSRYPDLTDEKELFRAGSPTTRKSERASAQETFDSLSLSEQTTFDAVTHALSRSSLSGQQGEPLGRALDLVADVERTPACAGVVRTSSSACMRLKPGARQTLERSRQFYVAEENTVFHVGFHPPSARMEEPTLQISMSETERADIDVDYRSSKSPQALFNGHLSSSNSDVYARREPVAPRPALDRVHRVVAGHVRPRRSGARRRRGPAANPRTSTRREYQPHCPLIGPQKPARQARRRRAGIPDRLARQTDLKTMRPSSPVRPCVCVCQRQR